MLLEFQIQPINCTIPNQFSRYPICHINDSHQGHPLVDTRFMSDQKLIRPLHHTMPLGGIFFLS